MGPVSMPDWTDHCASPDDQPTFYKDLEEMLKGDGQPSPLLAPHAHHSTVSTPPTTPGTAKTPATPIPAGNPLTPNLPVTPGTPLGPPTTPTSSAPYRSRLPSLSESDSQSSFNAHSDTASDAHSDSASLSSGADWANFAISPLVKEELKQAIVARRKTHGLPDVQVDFDPKPPCQLTPEEEDKREQQKERNRTAAAKCRSKKRNAEHRLVAEAEELESANEELRQEMKDLESERTRLQFLLDMHSSNCLNQVTQNTTLDLSTPQPKRTRTSTSVSTVISMPSASMSRPSTVTTPSTECSSAASMAHMSPTHSTTLSVSSTEPSTPAMTPTSIKDAPVCPLMAPSMSPVSSTHDGSACVEVEPLFNALCDPVGSPLPSTMPNTGGVLTNTMQTTFPPITPPTPEINDDDDPLSSWFVNQYLGNDAIGPGDLTLPVIADQGCLSPDQNQNSRLVGGPSLVELLTVCGSLAPPTVESQVTSDTVPDGPTESPSTLSFSALLGGSHHEDFTETADTSLQMPTSSAKDFPHFENFLDDSTSNQNNHKDYTTKR